MTIIHTKYGFAVIAGMMLVLVAVSLPAAGDEMPLRVGKVVVRSVDVFSPQEASHGFVYRTANALHIQTQESVIRELLLFREGDPYDPKLLAESERNLRRLDFVKLASVTAAPPHDGVVDVEVLTQDAWSTEPEISFGSKGGTTTYGTQISESNFLGLGKEIEFSYDKGIDRTTKAIRYRDPSFFLPYWRSELLFSDNSDGRQGQIEIERPFYSMLTPWATGFTVDNLTQRERIWSDSYEISEFEQQHRRAAASFGRALSSSTSNATRLSGGFDLFDDEFTPVTGTLTPENRRYRFVYAQLDTVQNEFIKLNYVNKDLRYEDFNLGRQLSLRLGVSPKMLRGENNAGMLGFAISDGRQLDRDSFVLPSFSLDTRLDGGPQNSIAKFDVRYTRRFETTYPQSLIARLSVNRGWELDRDVQFFADALTGMRGYRIHAFEGNKSAVLNIEQRWFLGREVLQLVSPGAAAFIDIGDAEPAGVPLSFSRLKVDLGVGLRIGVARTPRNLLRVDIAYALNEDPRGRGGLLISIGSSQAF